MISEIAERRKKQTIKVIITETCMLIAIVLLVAFLVMLTLGYNFSFNGEVEASGLVQINSVPTGASISVDGEGLFLPTNQSKTMSSGEHEISLTREGYSSWQKTITVREGMLYRLYYPRLYLEDRKVEEILPAKEELVLSSASISRDRKYLLNIYEGSTKWELLPLNDGEPKVKEIEVGSILGSGDEGYTGRIEIQEWSQNSSKILIKACQDDSCEWILVNLNEVEKSVNLSREFALNFSKVKIASDTADKLLVLADGNLYKIDTSDKIISEIMAKEVSDFSNYGSKVAYIKENSAYLYDEDGEILLYSLAEDSEKNLKILLSQYYNEDYLTVVYGDQMEVYYGKLPTINESFQKTMKELAMTTLDFTPSIVYERGGGELVVAANNTQMAVMDAESYTILQFETESVPGWLSLFDIYTIKDGWLTARDFDNSNPRALINDFDEKWPVRISENDKYIYYFKNNALIRETIR